MSQADVLFEAIRVLPPAERLRLVERIVHDLAGDAAPAPDPGAVIGLFAAEADLMDEIVDLAMEARSRDPLRRPVA